MNQDVLPLVSLYGIPNCDTVKKAKKWLEEKGIDYQFFNFKKDGINPDDVSRWIDQTGIDLVLNKRGTTWRKLSPQKQAYQTNEELINLICEQTSLVKRPVLEIDSHVHVGFKPDMYEELFK